MLLTACQQLSGRKTVYVPDTRSAYPYPPQLQGVSHPTVGKTLENSISF